MSTKYRIGIIGVGAIAEMHARAIADLPNAELVAATCRTEAKGRKFVETFGGVWHPTYEQMLDAEKPDLVTICTPSGAHLEPALAAFERGVHVLCEKPIEITLDRVDKMIAAAAKAGVTLGGIFPQRFNPVVQTIQQAAAGGRFGRLAVINSYVPWWRDDAYYGPTRWQGTLALDGGGALMNQSIHGVDAAQWIAAADPGTSAPGARDVNPVEEVFAYTARLGHAEDLIEVEDTCVIALRYRNGALGQILAATSMFPGSLKRLQIAGRDGTAELLEDELVTWQFRNEIDDDAYTRAKFSGGTSHGGGAADPMAIDYSNHTRNIEHFLDALDGKTKLMLDGAEARKAVAIITAVYESAKAGTPVLVG
ncbi:MAG: gfo/Idh/MocA family oxidoreductase [Phycisphaera sp.]|nr:gfo/Idh/MocA family oxidoreductase [Phycisphaera sp.]